MSNNIKIVLVILISILTSCQVATIDSERYKLLNLQKKGWRFHLNSNYINLEEIILNPENFSTFSPIKSKKQIFIVQKNKETQFMNILDIIPQDSLKVTDLVVIDGIPYSNADAIKIKIETSSTKSVTTLKDYEGFHGSIKNVILITTK